jgi:hypothetical protein
VFLNNSIEPATAGLECQTPAYIQKFPRLPDKLNPQNDPGYHKPSSDSSNPFKY